MRLHRESTVAVDEDRIFAEFIACVISCLCWAFYHLILVPCVQSPRCAAPVIGLRANGPSAFELLDFATEGLSDDLVTKADTHRRNLCVVGSANEVFERRDERVIFISAVFGAADEPAISGVHVCGEVHVDDIPCLVGKAFTFQELDKHRVVIAQIVQNFVRGVAGVQDTDFHKSPMGLFQAFFDGFTRPCQGSCAVDHRRKATGSGAVPDVWWQLGS